MNTTVAAALWLVLIVFVAIVVGDKVIRMLFARITKKVRQLRALRRVVRAANAWAQAERELRDEPSLDERLCRVIDPFDVKQNWKVLHQHYENHHRIVTAADFTENELLRAVEDARAEGLNLSR